MLRRSLMAGLCLLAPLFASAGQAADEFWVTVGSYQTISRAETARTEASQQLSESFGISEAQLDSGLWYRVVAGPYLSSDTASHIRDEAVRNGFGNAWVMDVTPEFISEPASTYSADAYRLETYSDQAYRSGLDGGAYEPVAPESSRYSVPASEPADIPGFNAPIREDRDKEHKLISEPPEDYRLHQLNRNQT